MDEKTQLVPIDEIRKLMKGGSLPISENQNTLSTKFDDAFEEYVNSDDENVKKQIEQSNKKTFKKLGKSKEKITGDIADTNVYQVRYEKEEWFYKSHKDTIDKYVKKEEKKQIKDKDSLVATIQNEPEEITRIGMAKMRTIVWFDLLIRTILFDYIICSPIQLIRAIAELFYRMKKSIAIAVAIITGIIVIGLGLYFGAEAIMNFARSSSNL